MRIRLLESNLTDFLILKTAVELRFRPHLQSAFRRSDTRTDSGISAEFAAISNSFQTANFRESPAYIYTVKNKNSPNYRCLSDS